MKSSGTGSVSPKMDESIQNQLMGTIGIHVGQSARIIFNIKQALYELVKINVSATAPNRKYQNTAAIVSGSKRNLDDLRRIQSMLKGYLNTVKVQEQNSEEDIRANIDKNMAKTFSSPLANKSNIQTNQPKEKLKNTKQSIELSTSNPYHNTKEDINEGIKILDRSQTENSYKQGKQSYVFEVQNLRHQNDQLKNQIKKLKEQTKNEIQKAIQQANNQSTTNNGRKQFANSNAIVTDTNSKVQQASQYKKQLQQNNVNLNIKIRQDLQEESQIIPQQSRRQASQQLKHCKSAIFDTSKNLKQIRNRNRQCLELIRNIKREIGLQMAES